MFRLSVGIILALSTPVLAGEKGFPTGNGTIVGRSPAEVLRTLATRCVKGGATVDQMTDTALICAQRMSLMRGALTQALIGGANSTVPILHVRFTALSVGADTLLQISQSVDMVSAFGKPINTPVPVKPSEVETIVAAASQREAPIAVVPVAPVATEGPKFGVQFSGVPDGLYIRSVTPGSPAAAAKMIPGMVITHLNGVPLAGMDQATVLRMLGAFQGEATFTVIGAGDIKIRKPVG